MTRVLVTGAGGFIGEPLVARLVERGYEVHAVARQPRRGPARVVWHAADLLDPASIDALVARVGAACLVHLAWCTDPGTYRQSPENLAWTEASLRLMRGFARAGGERAVLAGTVFEYGWSDPVCRELASPIRPDTLYGACKAALEATTRAAASTLGVSCAWGRIFWLYGPREQPGRLVSSLIASLLAGRTVALSAGTQRRDYLHVGDVAGALVALLDSSVEGPVNIGSGEAVAVKDIAERITSMLGGAGLLGFDPAQGLSEVPLVVADIARLRDEVGYRPRFDLDAGLRDAVEWWRAQAAGQTAASTGAA